MIRPTVLLAAWAVCCGTSPTGRAADDAFAPPAIPAVLADAGDELPTTIVQDRIVLELEDEAEQMPAPAESILREEMISDRALTVESLPEPPQILEVSSPALDGMLMDDFTVDEMPFEASSGRWFQSGGWYVGGESLWMDRSRNHRVNIVQDIAPNPSSPTQLSLISYTTMAQPFNVAPGARATIGKSLGRDYLDRDRFLEFVYYGGMSYQDNDGWNARANGTLVTPLNYNAPGFNNASTYFTSFNSDFNSWEWNYKLRRRLGRDQLVMSPGGNWTRHAERGWLPSLIVGTRLATTNEDFRLISSRTGVPSSQFGGDYVINASNWLFGLNLGGELISQNEFYYWGIRGRAAPALSFGSTNQTAFGINTNLPQGSQTISFSDQATRTGAGFIGDLTILAGWQIKPNFALQIGYDFLWIAGMATANRQFNLDNRDNNAIDVGGQTFYNGVSFGFNGSW
ncbi:MAG: hypothetical protein K8S94_10525 [Planctomycetia bacterium]|nr:hypothetical protein [Planctomycetia bacterium]